MHRLFNLFILFLIAVSLIACSSSQSTTSTQVTPTDTPNGAATSTAVVLATQDAALYATSAASITPTPTPAPPKWTTTHTFSGNGSKKTATFSVPDDWKILYTCTHQEMNVEGVLGVIVYTADNTIVDVAVNATCKPDVDLTKGETEEHQSGDIYLSIDGTGDWSISIQELR